MKQLEKPKSSEILQAQTAAFIAESDMDFNDKQLLMRERLGRDALSLGDDISVVTKTDARYKNEAGEWEDVPAGTERKVATKAEYVEFLRDKQGSRDKEIAGRAELITAYDRFAPDIDRLLTEVSNLEKPEDHPDYINEGISSRAYAVKHDGKEYVAIIPRFPELAVPGMDSRMTGAIRGKDNPHLEQMVAASYKKSITISERMPGKPIGELSPEDVAAIKPKHIAELAATLEVAAKRGVYIDFKPRGDNFLYDPEFGFGIIDIGALSSPASMEYITNRAMELPSQLGIANPDSYDPANQEVRNASLHAIQQRLMRALQSVKG